MEHIEKPKVEEVKLLDRYTAKKPAVGTLYLTATHLIYVDTSSNTRKETWILHHLIATVEKLPITTMGCSLLIHCKNFHVVHFVIPKERDCQHVYQSLLRLSQPGKVEELYAFLYNPKQQEEDDRKAGWSTVNSAMDYHRMGLPNQFWEVTDLNESYEVCSTYPSSLGIPKAASRDIVFGSAKFRSRGRIPTLSYFHKETNAAICRCSQPLSGFSARSLEDEQMLQAINQANPQSSYMYVVDTRPKLNAMANRAAGKGYENEDHYSNIRFQFVGIENIHVMRGSLQKLLEVCALKSPTMSDYLTGLENSGWLRHIKAVMDAGVFLAKAVAEEKASVLVHCSDGWDRTAQVCSLASILLDPYYRTVKGLMVLIEKEWISMGHKFTQRCGHVDGDPKEVSPVFTQFMECLWHLMEQYPCAFEYNEGFLLEIHNHVYSCQFGNFIGNCQREREEMRLQERTFSVWPFLWENSRQYRNPLYKCSLWREILRPNTLPLNFKFWCGMYNHFDKGMHPKQSILECLLTITQDKAEGEKNMTHLQRQLAVMDGVLADRASSTDTSPQHTPQPPPSNGHSTQHTEPLINGAEEVGLEEQEGPSAAETTGWEEQEGPSATETTGWEEQEGPSDTGTTGWEEQEGPSATGTTGWEEQEGPSDTGTTGWEEQEGPSATGTTGWEEQEGPSATGTTGWEEQEGPSAAETTGWESQEEPSDTATKDTSVAMESPDVNEHILDSS